MGFCTFMLKNLIISGGGSIQILYLKGLYVTFRNCLLTMTPVAVKSIKLLKNVDSLLVAYRCLSSFHREAQQHQQSYISWMKTLTVSEPDGIL